MGHPTTCGILPWAVPPLFFSDIPPTAGGPEIFRDIPLAIFVPDTCPKEEVDFQGLIFPLFSIV
jgi:hypothetical protein